VRLEISGFGPTDMRYVDPANAPKTPEGQGPLAQLAP
jgi:hypothetical protein